MASIPTSWNLIEEVLHEHAHSVFKALRKPASETLVQRLQARISFNLPRDFVLSLKTHDGLNKSYLDEIRLFNYWALLPITAILTEWKSMTELANDGMEAPAIKAGQRIKGDAYWRGGWVPFMDADGDKVFIDLDPGTKGKVGQVVKWSNSGSFAPKVLADSFGEWLHRVATVLSQREFRLDESGSIWLTDETLA